MEKININHIMKQFDLYVQKYLGKKQLDPEEQQPPLNQLEQYFHTMEKRLKLRTVANYEKFQNLLKPMKKLKSFVSIKTFLRQLNVKAVKKQDSSNQQLKQKLKYQQLRGGFYIQKIQNHLRNYHLKRKLDHQAQALLQQLEANPTQRNQYTNWIESVLGKISMKEQTFLKLKPQNIDCRRQDQVSEVKNDLKANKNKNSRKQFLKRKSKEDQQQKNFKKVGDFLSERLRKILTDKYGGNKNKKQNNLSDYYHKQNNELYSLSSANKKTCRTAGISKRMRIDTSCNGKRAQTTQIKSRNSQNIWKNKLNNKLNDILNEADTEVKKGKQEIMKLNMLRNGFYEQCNKAEI